MRPQPTSEQVEEINRTRAIVSAALGRREPRPAEVEPAAATYLDACRAAGVRTPAGHWSSWPNTTPPTPHPASKNSGRRTAGNERNNQ